MNPSDRSEREENERNEISRREFLAKSGVVGAVGVAGASIALSSPRANAAAPQKANNKAPKKVPMVVLGRTGKRVSKLGFGGSWNIDSGVLAAGVDRGINYFDTAEGYLSGQSEKWMGEFIRENCKRNDVYLVTKTHNHHNLEAALEGSLRRLKLDYVDTMYLHDIHDVAILSAADVKAAGEKLKKAGKIKYFGFSCHHPPCLTDALEKSAELGYFDVVMFRYSYRDRDSDAMNRAIDKCAKANMGLVAMKTLTEPIRMPAKFDVFAKEGLNKVQSALKAIWADERIHTIVSEMVAIDHIDENSTAATKKLTKAENSALRRYAALTSHLACRGCEQICSAAAGSTVAVADILRFQMYHDCYNKPARARELYAELPAHARDLSQGDWAQGEAACPHSIPLRRLLAEAEYKLG